VLGILIVFFMTIVLFMFGIRILNEYERGVVFRLGRYVGIREAGFRWIIPGVDRMVRISLREIVMDVPAQEVITLDNVSVKVNAVLYQGPRRRAQADRSPPGDAAGDGEAGGSRA